MNHPSELYDSTLLLMAEQRGISDNQAIAIQKTSLSFAPFYKAMDSISIENARNRRSSRNFGSLELSNLAELLHLSMFNTNTEGLRPYPAAGGIYSVNMYFVSLQVKQLPAGIHFLRWSDKSLEQIGTED